MFKAIFRAFFLLLVRLAYLAYRIEGVNALLLIMPSKLIVPTLRRYGAKIGTHGIIHSPLLIHNAGESYANLILGESCYFGRGVFLDLKEAITLGDRVTLSMKTTLITHTDAGDASVKRFLEPSSSSIQIESDAYLGANVLVLQGVRIGLGSVVGAGSVVLHDVPPGVVVAGNPAKEIRRL